MINFKFFSSVCLVSGSIFLTCSQAAIKDQSVDARAPADSVVVKKPKQVQQFIKKMSSEHGFDKNKLSLLFQSVELKPAIIKAMTRPAEAMPWYKYRKIFMTDARIEGGIKFWQEHEQTLTELEKQTGVPAAIIVAIIGVETYYGKNTGHFRVIDALSTLSFDYPKRSPFFTSELEHFLLLCREEAIDPLTPVGSYAGAMGLPQFMPSSFRAYAKDFDGDKLRDIWNNPNDVIASVANYFVKHHWQPGKAIAYKVGPQPTAQPAASGGDLKPDTPLSELKHPIQIPSGLDPKQNGKLLSFEQENGQDLWLILDNFYVITRYNHSPLYALAVFQLSQAIEKNRTETQHD